MGSLPLHPAIVHVPLGIAFIVPFLALAVLTLGWRRGLSRRTWALVVGVQATLVAAGIVAMRSGEAEEERVEEVVAESAIGVHEDAAEAFVWGAAGALALAALVLVLPPARARVGAVAATVVMIGVLGLAVRAGHAGGTLVYAHNAGAAYAVPGAAGEGMGDYERAPAAGPAEAVGAVDMAGSARRSATPRATRAERRELPESRHDEARERRTR